MPLGLAEVAKDRVDELESGVDLFAHFGSSQDDLSRDEYEQHDLRLHHTIDQTREKLRLVGRESMMATGQSFQTNSSRRIRNCGC